MDIHTMRPVFSLVKARKRYASNPCKNPVQRFEHHHLLAEFAEHCSRFKADVTPANHHDALCRRQFGQYAVDVGTRAHCVYAREITAGAGQASRHSPAGPDEPPITNPSPVIERHLVCAGVDRLDSPAELQREPLLIPEPRGPNEQAVKRLLPREVFLRERRARVRQFALFPDQCDRSVEPDLAQRDGRLGTALTRPDDEDVE